jgi:hypothetical protein
MATYGTINQDAFKSDINPADRNSYAIQAGYTGWDDYQANANKPAQGNPSMTNAQVSGGMGGGMGSGVGFTAPTNQSLNLPDLYKSLTADSGISNIEADLSKKTQEYNDAISQINDNPFLSEATRVGRIQKLTTDFNNRTANLKNDISTRKADVETQLNLQSKQFDINNQMTQQAVSQFNTLLSLGALDNASFEDISNITRSTGLSSQMIQSAINTAKTARQKKEEIPTQMVSFDDGTNTGFALINTQTGDVINKQNISTSKPKTTSTSSGTGGHSTSSILSTASGALKAVDTNKDKAVSINEFATAVKRVMDTLGIDYNSAYDYTYQALTKGGYKTWNWSKA